MLHEHGRLRDSQLFYFVWQETPIRRAELGNSLRALPQLYELILHSILEEQSIFTQGIHPSQAALLELVGQGGKGSDKKKVA